MTAKELQQEKQRQLLEMANDLPLAERQRAMLKHIAVTLQYYTPPTEEEFKKELEPFLRRMWELPDDLKMKISIDSTAITDNVHVTLFPNTPVETLFMTITID